MTDATTTYSDEESPKTTRAYGEQTPRTATAAHNLTVGDTITLNDNSYTPMKLHGFQVGRIHSEAPPTKSFLHKIRVVSS